jgi:hypothetical protein
MQRASVVFELRVRSFEGISMSFKGWFLVSGLWLGAVLFWMRFGPTQGGHVGRVGVNRFWTISSIYLFAFAYQVFIFGWLIPLGVAIYKVVRK